MGLLIEGKWHDQWYDTSKTGGRFVRSESAFRHPIDTQGTYTAEPGRYHLYVSYACPWAHRTLIFRKLKGLEKIIGVSVVHPLMLEHGWTFDSHFKGCAGDALYQLDYLYQLYLKADDNYSGRVTVPVLWDKHTKTIVNNESADIIRLFNSAFDDIGASQGDYYPEPLREQIDEINDWVYHQINNGVYKAGFATSQAAYEEAVGTLFEALDRVEDILSQQPYLVGDTLTEADWRLFTTLIRFDAVYVQHFKCNIKRMADYHHISRYLQALYQHPGIADTVHLDHIQHHYFRSHANINPSGIIPAGPELDFLSE